MRGDASSSWCDCRLRGCLIGGAIGANTENLPMEVVYERHGPAGVTQQVYQRWLRERGVADSAAPELLDPRDARVPQRGELAIALYSALVTDDPNHALLISVNHGGDSDSTASMCGNLVGALHGVDKIRPDWVERVQFRDVIDRMIADWAAETGPAAPMAQEWFTRYPPS